MTNLVQVSTTVKEYGDKYRIEIERADGSGRGFAIW